MAAEKDKRNRISAFIALQMLGIDQFEQHFRKRQVAVSLLSNIPNCSQAANNLQCTLPNKYSTFAERMECAARRRFRLGRCVRKDEKRKRRGATHSIRSARFGCGFAFKTNVAVARPPPAVPVHPRSSVLHPPSSAAAPPRRSSAHLTVWPKPSSARNPAFPPNPSPPLANPARTEERGAAPLNSQPSTLNCCLFV